MLRILRRTLAAASLLLFLAIVLFWIAAAMKPRVIWWNHGGTFAHYHVATIREGRLVAAHYRETSASPTVQRMQLETESVALKHEQMELLTDWLDLMVNRKNPDPVQVSQARA